MATMANKRMLFVTFVDGTKAYSSQFVADFDLLATLMNCLDVEILW